MPQESKTFLDEEHVSPRRGYVGLRVVVQHDVRDASALQRAIAAFHAALHEKPKQIQFAGKVRAFKEATLGAVLGDDGPRRAAWWTAGDPPTLEVHTHLRDDPAASELRVLPTGR